MGHTGKSMERGDDRPTVFYQYIEVFETSKLDLCLGKGNVSKKIQEPLCEY